MVPFHDRTATVRYSAVYVDQCDRADTQKETNFVDFISLIDGDTV